MSHERVRSWLYWVMVVVLLVAAAWLCWEGGTVALPQYQEPPTPAAPEPEGRKPLVAPEPFFLDFTQSNETDPVQALLRINFTARETIYAPSPSL